MSIVDYFRKKKNGGGEVPKFDVPAFENERYWFSRRMPKNMWRFGPFARRIDSKKVRYNLNTTKVIGDKMYGKAHKASKATPLSYGTLDNIWEGVHNKYDVIEHISDVSENAEVLSLLDNGVTFERMLGKEWDNDLRRSVAQGVKARYSDRDVDYAKTATAKRAYVASKESRMTPSDAIRYMQWERVVKDPSIINHLLTKEGVKKLGYVWNSKNQPISVFHTTGGKPLYDVVGMVDDNELVPNYTLDRSINNVLKNVPSTSMELFSRELLKATGVKLTLDKEIKVEDVDVRKRRLRSVVRKAKNAVTRTLGREEHALDDSIELAISPHGTPAERTYLLVRDIAHEAILPMLRATEKECVRKGDDIDGDRYLQMLARVKTSDVELANLPTYEELNANRDIILDVASDLIASQVVKMGSLNDKESKALSELYKVDAMQVLSKVEDKENTWMMPLIASYVGMALPKFAKDLNVDIKEYGKKNNIQDAETLAEAVYGEVKWDAAQGVLTSRQTTPRVNNDAFDDIDPDYEPKFFDFDEINNAFRKEDLETDKLEIAALYSEIDNLLLGYYQLAAKRIPYDEDTRADIREVVNSYDSVVEDIKKYQDIVDAYQYNYNELYGKYDDSAISILPIEFSIMEFLNKQMKNNLLMDSGVHLYENSVDYSMSVLALVREWTDTAKQVLVDSGINNVETKDVKAKLAELDSTNIDAACLDGLALLLNDVTNRKDIVGSMLKWVDGPDDEYQKAVVSIYLKGFAEETLPVSFKALEKIEDSYLTLREKVLSKDVITDDDKAKYQDEIDELYQDQLNHANNIKQNLELFAKYADKYDEIKNSELWQEIDVDRDIVDDVLGSFENLSDLLLSELEFVQSVGTADEELARSRYADTFANYIREEKRLSKEVELVDFTGSTKKAIAQQVEKFRSVYARGLEQDETSVNDVASDWVNLFGDVNEGLQFDVETAVQEPSMVNSHNDKAIPLDSVTVEEFIRDANKVAEAIKKGIAQNEIVEKIKTASLQANALKDKTATTPAQSESGDTPKEPTTRKLTGKEKSTLIWKLRSGQISYREYLDAIKNGVPVNKDTVKQDLVQANIVAETVENKIAQNEIVEKFRTASLQANALKEKTTAVRVAETKAETNSANVDVIVQDKIVQASNVAKVVEEKTKQTVLERYGIVTNANVPATDEKGAGIKDAKLQNRLELLEKLGDGVCYGGDVKPGYVESPDGSKLVFSPKKYNEEMKYLKKNVAAGEIPDFATGENLVLGYEEYMQYVEKCRTRSKQYSGTNMKWDSDVFMAQIVKNAKKTIAKALKNEYNSRVKATGTQTSKTKEYGDDEVSSAMSQQDIASNIWNHFVAKSKSTKTAIKKGEEYNERFVAQLRAAKSLAFTAEQIATKVQRFYGDNRDLLQDYTPNTIYNLYLKSVGADKLENTIRTQVLQPMIDKVHDDVTNEYSTISARI
ncbi:MAG: hypothetical protein IKC79_02060 [Clostridia bacterium]|nr:hypothetical protein [Clostridia bacterium]